MDLPDLSASSSAGSGSGSGTAPLPELLIVNMMIPSYSPSRPFSRKRTNGPGQSVVMFARLSDWARNRNGNGTATDDSGSDDASGDPALQLWSRFVHAFDGDGFRERLKMITRT